MLVAVHHATDTLTHIAVTDQRCVGQAVADHGLYIPTRLLPEDDDIPYRYTPAPRSRVTALLDGYRLAVKTCTAATTALDDLALAARVHPACWLQPIPPWGRQRPSTTTGPSAGSQDAALASSGGCQPCHATRPH